jgi:CPA2 family monovalent cation:H+ antiporter-2
LLLGTAEQVLAGKEHLGAVSGTPGAESEFADVRMETLVLPAWSQAAGKALGELTPAQRHGVQIAGVHRGGLRILNPTAQERLRVGDEVLLLGTPVQLREFQRWLREQPEGANPGGAE